jgi:hypothetical protein
MKTKIIKFVNDWKYVKNVSRTTVGKQHTEIEPTKEFKKKIKTDSIAIIITIINGVVDIK